MPSPCIIKDASTSCFRRCCPKHLPELPGNSQQQAKTRTLALSFHPNAQYTNHESIPSIDQAYANMKRAYPNYPETDRADRIRDQEYYHLSSNHVCLDYNGHGLFSYSQHAPFFNIIYKSVNLYTQITRGGRESESEFETKIKERLFRFMNISSDDYSLVFTANQSSAFKVLADAYPFHTNFTNRKRNLLTVYDHQNEAVDAMIESCVKRSGRVDSAVFSWPNMRIQSKKLRKMIVTKNKKRKKRGLFVFPVQSMVTGTRYSYLWMSLARENGWHVCLDANGLGSKDMETLGLSLFQPDFVVCSFYKIFGDDPSGFGCLFIKKTRSSVFKHSTNSGLVNIVLASDESSILQESRSISKNSENPESVIKGKTVLLSSSTSSNQLETPEIQEIKETNEETKELSLLEVLKRDKSLDTISSTSKVTSDIEFRGLDNVDSLGLVLISSRVSYLVNWLLNALGSLKHPHLDKEVPLVTIYGPKVRVNRGPVVAFNVFDWKGEKIEATLVQKLACRHNISLSCGILKNASFVDKNSVLTKNEEKVDLGVTVVMGTVSFLTNFEDVYRVWGFVSKFLDADFVEKERWRYMGINQTTVEV